MMDMDGPLDFETEDQLLHPPPVVNKKRKKVIELDDLLADFYKEKSKCIEKENKKKKQIIAGKSYNSDDDENGKEALLSVYVSKCQNQIKDLSGEEEILEWGLSAFGSQKPRPSVVFTEIQSCSLLHSFIDNKLNSLVELTSDTGAAFLEGLLLNGWLKTVVLTCGHIEKSLATWTCNLIFYSPREELRISAFEFWSTILSSFDEDRVRIDWFPSFSDFKGALDTYGFLFEPSNNKEPAGTDSGDRGLSKNIGVWIKLVSACCKIRTKRCLFSATEAEGLVEVVICLLLDRQLQGLSFLLNKCMESVVEYFEDTKWATSCEKIAKSLGQRVPKDLNCLRTVECISGVKNRSKHLKSTVAYQMLLVLFDHKATDDGIMSLLISLNLKERGLDLFKVYIYLVLSENWLLPNSVVEKKPVLSAMWGVFLRNCSCQISSTDLRSYAPKVRNKAAYLLQFNGSF